MADLDKLHAEWMRREDALGDRNGFSPATRRALAVIERFSAMDPGHHAALDDLLAVARHTVILRRDATGAGLMTRFELRALAACLLGAAELPPDASVSQIEPRWLSPEDEAVWLAAEIRWPLLALDAPLPMPALDPIAEPSHARH